MRITGNDKKIQHGEYYFDNEVSLLKIINNIVNGNFYYRKIIIPECSTIDEVIKILTNNPYLIGKIEKIPKEGSMFPDTYFFQRNDSRNSLIIRMQNKMNQEVNSIWENNNTHLSSQLELIKLASIIEAEAIKKNEKYIISSVFHNRIKIGMKLQSDPTILYFKNVKKKIKTRKIFKKDLKLDNPWNTYTRYGLPKTPICNPGIDAIKAALKPNRTDYLYFVSNGIGGHRFSSNLKQHLKNVKLWKKHRELNENEK